ncbi:hypothetical protein V1478_012172 [Vespula squamosa]|uniref:Uncharacterized protein n=1 Tax=Vespula squamosa TaxID=30214 RepID=A0ABD2AD23_VESSQ
MYCKTLYRHAAYGLRFEFACPSVIFRCLIFFVFELVIIINNICMQIKVSIEQQKNNIEMKKTKR